MLSGLRTVRKEMIGAQTLNPLGFLVYGFMRIMTRLCRVLGSAGVYKVVFCLKRACFCKGSRTEKFSVL